MMMTRICWVFRVFEFHVLNPPTTSYDIRMFESGVGTADQQPDGGLFFQSRPDKKQRTPKSKGTDHRR